MRVPTLLFIFGALKTYASEKTFYLDFEHPNITYLNPKYYAYVNMSALRRHRRDPIHYVSVHCETLLELGNNIQVDLFVYEFLSNEYRRSFLEYHHKLCDLMQKEKAFLPYIMKYLPIKTCPFPKGQYHALNIAFPNVPLLKTFPFTKGRLFTNVSEARTKERLLETYIDAVIKEKLR